MTRQEIQQQINELVKQQVETINNEKPTTIKLYCNNNWTVTFYNYNKEMQFVSDTMNNFSIVRVIEKGLVITTIYEVTNIEIE